MANGFTPDGGQRVDAQGHITYDFTGHIHAQGLDLDAGADIATIPNDRRVRWQLQSDGSVVADVYGTYYDSGQGFNIAQGVLEALRRIPQDVARATLRAALPSGVASAEARLDAVSDPEPGGGSRPHIDAYAGGRTALLTDDAGRSSFIQAPGATGNYRIEVGVGQARVSILAGWSTYDCPLQLPVTAGNVMSVPFYSIIPDGGATLGGTEVHSGGWNIGSAPITAIRVDANSAVAQGAYLNALVVAISQ